MSAGTGRTWMAVLELILVTALAVPSPAPAGVYLELRGEVVKRGPDTVWLDVEGQRLALPRRLFPEDARLEPGEEVVVPLDFRKLEDWPYPAVGPKPAPRPKVDIPRKAE